MVARGKRARSRWCIPLAGWLLLLAPQLLNAGEALIMPKASESLLLDAAMAGERMVVVGEQGHILFSDGVGEQWNQAIVPTRQMLTATHFATARRGWAVGHDGLILASEDAGAHWTLQRDGLHQQQSLNREHLQLTEKSYQQTKQRLLEESGIDERKKLLVTLADLELELEDAQDILSEAVHAPPLLDVFFLDELRGFAVGAFNTLLRTTDGGVRWVLDSQALENPDEYHLYAITGDGESKLWIATEGGLLFHSTDGGGEWHALPSPYRGSWFGIVFQADTNVLMAFGLRGNVYRSTDSGSNWQQVSVNTSQSLTGGQFSNEHSVLIVGAMGTFLVSEDGGRSFTQKNLEQRASLSAVVGKGDRTVLVGQGGIYEVAR